MRTKQGQYTLNMIVLQKWDVHFVCLFVITALSSPTVRQPRTSNAQQAHHNADLSGSNTQVLLPGDSYGNSKLTLFGAFGVFSSLPNILHAGH